MSISLTDRERERYGRQILLDELGEAGQLQLKAASVAVVGAGGLGSPALLYLAAAGIGTLGIIDGDHVDASNLHRQVLFGESVLGQAKAEVAAFRLLDLNPHIDVQPLNSFLTADNGAELLEPYDIVVDACDNFATRYLLDDVCRELGKPWVHGAIHRVQGQVTVFNAGARDAHDAPADAGPGYRDLFPHPPTPDSDTGIPANNGLLGVLPGTLGCLMANEVIKLAAGLTDPLIGRLLLLDMSEPSVRVVAL